MSEIGGKIDLPLSEAVYLGLGKEARFVNVVGWGETKPAKG